MDSIIREKKKKRQKRNYFTKETEEAIVRYNNSSDPEEKSDLYGRYIHYPFYKLTENIIHTFKFYYTEVENLEDLQHEIIIFLLDKIHHYEASKGSAYSYFGTIVKRWLIGYNNKNYKNKKNNIPVINLDNYSNIDKSSPNFIYSDRLRKEINDILDYKEETYEGDELTLQGYKYGDRLSFFVDEYTKYCSDNIFKFFPKEYDAKIADAVLELFRKREIINEMLDGKFNKKALYIYIREMVDVKTPKITKIANQLYKIFQEKYLLYIELGYFPS